jgi:hypothetical protein
MGLKADVVWVVVVVDEVVVVNAAPRKEVSGAEGTRGNGAAVCRGDEGATGDSLPRRIEEEEEEESRLLSSPEEEKNDDEEEKNEDDEEKNGDVPMSERG